MSWFAPPKEIESKVFARLPAKLRKPHRNAWADANKGGAAIDSFLEGPCLTADGTLLVTDIPYGRILATDGADNWRVVAEYDGWPNGMKVLPDGRLLIADYKRGLVRIEPGDGRMEVMLATINGEGFKG